MENKTETGSERRQFFRIDMEEELIDIQWVDTSGNTQNNRISCLDFSRGGVRINCDFDIPMNTEVTVVFQAAAPSSQRLYGRVIRSIQQGDGSFEIALKLVD